MATICASGPAIIKAGANVAATVPPNSWDTWIEESEGFLSSLIKYDLVANWASLSANYKTIFSDYCARSAAIQGITYDMNGYTTRIEAEDMINVHLYIMNEIKKLLDNSNVQDFQGV